MPAAPSDRQWYVLHLYVETDKFLAKYPSLPAATRGLVAELLHFTKPDKGLYEREAGGIFVGYIFAAIAAPDVKTVHRALRGAGLGEVFGYSEGYARPLDEAEMGRILEVMRSAKQERFAVGAPVRIKSGPYEGMEGTVAHVVGQTVSVRVELLRSVSYADISLDNLEEAA